ncbi:transglutaminaseTgpA domain-containing protein [Haloarculaceae archaeon H-GB2-1]|nr:transglutaminaseTgpA domain-containing protein [Haloarculaceae archaeon H-GB2-1]
MGKSPDPSNPRGRDAFVAVCCALGLVVAALFAPTIAAHSPFAGTGRTSPGDLVAGTGSASAALADEAPSEMGTQTGGSAGSLGALSPSASTSVGSPAAGDAFSQQSNDVHLVLHSDRPHYLRTAAYDRYTGDGFERSTGESFDSLATADLHGSTAASGTVSYRVELRRSATSVPVVWKPRRLDEGALGTGLAVAPTGGIRAETAVPNGTTYRAVSAPPPASVSRLRDASGGYPAAIYDRYTQLPAETPDRVTELSHRVVGDAATSYDQARRIERYLESQKAYSTNTTHERGQPVADQFLFEMAAGDCEYFASTMVVMLRTQGVPARYVVGYAPGERAGEDTYVVRGKYAHAWVEVYFPDTGWVRFDPTPASGRRQADRRAANASTPSGVPGGDGETTAGGPDGTSTATGGGGNRSGAVLPEPLASGPGAVTRRRPTGRPPNGPASAGRPASECRRVATMAPRQDRSAPRRPATGPVPAGAWAQVTAGRGRRRASARAATEARPATGRPGSSPAGRVVRQRRTSRAERDGEQVGDSRRAGRHHSHAGRCAALGRPHRGQRRAGGDHERLRRGDDDGAVRRRDGRVRRLERVGDDPRVTRTDGGDRRRRWTGRRGRCTARRTDRARSTGHDGERDGDSDGQRVRKRHGGHLLAADERHRRRRRPADSSVADDGGRDRRRRPRSERQRDAERDGTGADERDRSTHRARPRERFRDGSASRRARVGRG